jgi:DNA repair exonuclease SbcCD ATPase subunit
MLTTIESSELFDYSGYKESEIAKFRERKAAIKYHSDNISRSYLIIAQIVRLQMEEMNNRSDWLDWCRIELGYKPSMSDKFLQIGEQLTYTIEDGGDYLPDSFRGLAAIASALSNCDTETEKSDFMRVIQEETEEKGKPLTESEIKEVAKERDHWKKLYEDSEIEYAQISNATDQWREVLEESKASQAELLAQTESLQQQIAVMESKLTEIKSAPNPEVEKLKAQLEALQSQADVKPTTAFIEKVPEGFSTIAEAMQSVQKDLREAKEYAAKQKQQAEEEIAEVRSQLEAETKKLFKIQQQSTEASLAKESASRSQKDLEKTISVFSEVKQLVVATIQGLEKAEPYALKDFRAVGGQPVEVSVAFSVIKKLNELTTKLLAYK